MSLEMVRTHRHTESVASTSWVITHNLNTITPLVDVWVDIAGTTTKILPQTVAATSASVVTLTFSTAYAGEAVIA